jgi:hypothetical protein
LARGPAVTCFRQSADTYKERYGPGARQIVWICAPDPGVVAVIA